ncbi:MAG: GGDEF domain-containing protein [Bacillota bacterium]
MRKAWEALWKSPDAAMLVAGGEGERQVANVRVVVVTLLLLTPVYRQLFEPFNLENLWGLVVTMLAMLFAVAVYRYLRRHSYQPWMGFLTSSFDGSLVTLALVIFMVVGGPYDAVNDKITFEVYFLVIMAMSLRQDRRICVVVGAFLVLHYAAIFAFVMHHFDIAKLNAGRPWSGQFNTVDQWTRLILLSSAVFISYAYVVRSQTLVNRAIRDPLTGLLNRGYFDTLFDYEIEKARRYGQCFAVVLVDADHFKRINDSEGHAAGDLVLKVLANTLVKSVRESDVVVRFGGEEFVLLLHETDAESAFHKADALREAVGRLVVGAPQHAIQVTLSAGVAIYPDDGTVAHVLLSRADQWLMQAKNAGRNRVIGARSDADTAERTAIGAKVRN